MPAVRCVFEQGMRTAKLQTVMNAVGADRKLSGSNLDRRRHLLLNALDWHEAHVGSGDGLTDRCGIGRIVLTSFAREAVGGDELGCHQAHV